MNDAPCAVLMFHRLGPGGARDPYEVPAATFDRHLAQLATAGFRGASLRDALTQPDLTVVISFDDGNSTDFWIALPALRRHGFTATFFLTTERIGSGEPWLGWEHVRALHDAGMQLGAHGHTHRFFDELSDDDLRRELELPRELIRQMTGVETTVVSCPGGRHDARTLAFARQAGYACVADSWPALATPIGIAAGMAPRFQVRASTSSERVLDLARGERAAIWPLTAKAVISRSAQRLIGNRAYQRLWEWRYGSAAGAP